MKSLIAICSLMLMSACGDGVPSTYMIQQPLYSNTPKVGTIQRGYFTGCKGYVQSDLLSPGMGYFYRVSPVYCNTLVYYNIWIEQSNIRF